MKITKNEIIEGLKNASDFENVNLESLNIEQLKILYICNIFEMDEIFDFVNSETSTYNIEFKNIANKQHGLEFIYFIYGDCISNFIQTGSMNSYKDLLEWLEAILDDKKDFLEWYNKLEVIL